MEGTIHALILMSTIPVTLEVIWMFGGLPRTPREVVQRVALGLGILALFVIMLGAFYCPCGPGNNPINQLLLPAVLTVIAALFIDKRRISLAFAGMMLVAAIGLGYHFHHLVLNPERCAYTGHAGGPFISNSCHRPAEAIPLWYTPLTGLYGLQQK